MIFFIYCLMAQSNGSFFDVFTMSYKMLGYFTKNKEEIPEETKEYKPWTATEDL